MSSSGKRDIPDGLKQVLEWDKKVTKEVFEYADRTYGLPNYRPYLKYLEVSCHGLPWLFGVFAMTYLFPESMQLWMNLLWLLFVDIVIVAFLKAFTRRRRPSYNNADMFATVSVDKFSFPSGHSTRAVVLAFFFSSLYPLPAVVALVIFVWAAAVCVSRVLLGRHHVLDVLGGVAVGFVEYLVLCLTFMGEERAKGIADYFFGDDPWSNA